MEAQTALAILQTATGAFFAISGWHKLTNADRHAALVKTLTDDNVPLVAFNQWWVPGVEVVCGAALTAGAFLAPVVVLPTSLLLFVICAVACAVDAGKRVEAMQPIDLADAIDDWLYLPEVIYGGILAVSVATEIGRIAS